MLPLERALEFEKVLRKWVDLAETEEDLEKMEAELNFIRSTRDLTYCRPESILEVQAKTFRYNLRLRIAELQNSVKRYEIFDEECTRWKKIFRRYEETEPSEEEYMFSLQQPQFTHQIHARFIIPECLENH